MNLIRKLHPSRLIQDDGPPNVIADEQDVTVPAGNPGDTITVAFAIDQRDMPVGQVVCFDFSDQTLPVAVLRRNNNTSGQVEVALYCFAPVAGGTETAHWAIIRHAGF